MRQQKKKYKGDDLTKKKRDRKRKGDKYEPWEADYQKRKKKKSKT
jgi:hypothetical protein